MGAPAPGVKGARVRDRPRRWHDLMDVDAGRIATGECTIEAMGWELFHRLLAVASGERTWAEKHRLHNALVLFNPALVLADAPEADFKVSSLTGVTERLGAKPETVSPFHNVTKGAPPTIIFHGKADTTVPYKTAEAFTAKMKASGNRCELAGYEGQAHGFFNYGRGNDEYYDKTVQRAAEFLAALGYLR